MIVPLPTQLKGAIGVRDTACRTECGPTRVMLGFRAHPVHGVAEAGLASVHIAQIDEIDAVLAIGHQFVRFVVAPH